MILSFVKNFSLKYVNCMGHNIKLFEMEALAKVLFMVRQAHHERKKVNNSSMTSVRPELAEGYLRSFARGSMV